MTITRPTPLHLPAMVSTYPITNEPQSRLGRFIKALFKKNWRRAVIAVAILYALRFGIHANLSYNDISVDASHNLANLASVALALAVMYSIATGIQIFGIFSAAMQRLPLVRAYIFLSFVAALLAAAASLVDVVVYFNFMDELTEECASLAMVGKVSSKSTFINDNWPSGISKNSLEAYSECLAAWNSGASYKPVSFVLLNLLPNLLVFLVPYIYYRQLSNPMHPHGAPSAIPMGAYPGAQYSPLYNSAASAHHHNVPPPREPPVHSAPVSVTLHGYDTAAGASSLYTPGPPSFRASRDGGYPMYEQGPPGYSASSERGEFV